ncbi:MAG TPA: cupin domain-containing protein [Gaiellales bacterium]|jgi:quercetin dioxygenase-like cupin family protein|nr:cupin domain-containing protein [Gaiellales bacterium]
MHAPNEDEARSHVVAALAGDALWFNGALQNIKVPGEWSDDAFSLVEVVSTGGRATGLHTDPSHETFYLLEGTILFHVDGDEHQAQAGETVAIRRGVPHAFLVTSETARFLVMNTPGGHDRFFRAGGEPASSRDLDSAPAPDLERTMAAAHAHGVVFLGPPPFAAASVRTASGSR